MEREKSGFNKIKYTLLSICIAVIAVCGYKMYTLPLWEWWTFPFLCALWAVVVLLFLKRYNVRFLAFSTLSGVLFCIGFPPHSFPPALFFAFVPLLIIEKEIREKMLENGKWALHVGRGEKKKNILTSDFYSSKSNVQNPTSEIGLMRYAFNTFVVFNIGVTWWVANAGLIPGLIANYLNAFFMATAFWLYHRFNRTLDNGRWTLGKKLPKSEIQRPTSNVHYSSSIILHYILDWF